MRLKLIFLFLFYCMFSFCQEQITVKELGRTDALTVDKKNVFKEEILIGENGYYVFQIVDFKQENAMEIERGSYQILHFDKNLKLIKTKKIDIKHRTGFGSTNEVRWVKMLQGKIVFFVTEKNRNKKIKHIYAYSYNPITLELLNSKKVMESSLEGLNKNFNEIGFNVSEDESKILIYEINPLRKINYELLATVVDIDFDIQWNKKITNDDLKRKNFSIGGTAIANDGVSYFNLGKDQRKGDNEILKINTDAFKAMPLYFGKNVRGLKMKLTPNQKVCLVGFYSDSSTKHDTDGILRAVDVGNENEMNFEYSSLPLSKDFLNLFSNKKKISPRTGEGSYQPRDIFFKENGNWVIIGEDIFTVNSSGASNMYSPKSYFHTNIMVVELTKEGELFWTQKIPLKGKIGEFDSNENTMWSYKIPRKIFYTFNRSVQTFINNKNFYFFPLNDSLYFIYRDHIENMGYDGSESLKIGNGKNFQISLGRITQNGNLNISTLLSYPQDGIYYFNPGQVANITKDEILFFTREKGKENKKKGKFIRIKIEEN